jgi:hypothetical protein
VNQKVADLYSLSKSTNSTCEKKRKKNDEMGKKLKEELTVETKRS